MFDAIEPKNYQIIFKVTERERQFIESESKKKGVKLSQLVRTYVRAGIEALYPNGINYESEKY